MEYDIQMFAGADATQYDIQMFAGADATLNGVWHSDVCRYWCYS